MGYKLKPEKLVLWADALLLVANKPAGLRTVSDGYDSDSPFLLEVLRQAFGPLWVVHRLDRETSGVLVLARTPESHQNLNAQFESHRVIKVYHALAIGNPSWTELTAELALRPDGDRQHRTVVDLREGKSATTRFRVLERFRRYTLIEAIPETGRTHQIRAHLATQGFPIAVDPLYGDGESIYLSAIKHRYRSAGMPERPLLKRLGLHAQMLTLHHPTNDELLSVEAPYPKDFSAVLRQLRLWCS